MRTRAHALLLSAARRCVFALLACCFASITHADVFRPAYLELREAGQDASGTVLYDVMWKRPALGDSRLAIQIRFPQGTTQVTAPQGVFNDTAYIERWRISRAGGLTGQTLTIDGMVGGITDVMVRIERQDGTSQVERLLPQSPQFTVLAATGTAEVAWSYLVLGVEHILGGIDHLLFVLALLLIVRGGRRILMTITGFTVAHSITLVCATLGWMQVPGPPVEAMIALSIVFVAAEIIRGLRGRPGLTARAPWIVAFSFGLLHGFGFAGALAQVGLPQKAVPLALVTFNVGVEVGQLMFVALAVGVRTALSRLRAPKSAWMSFATPYAIGCAAMFWMIERVAAFF
jgi:hydrogenase/urease accessory protein HupE